MRKPVYAFIIALLCLALVSCASSAAVGVSAPEAAEAARSPAAEVRDFAAETKLDMYSSTLKQVVSIKTFIDGDTTHFNVPASVLDSGVLKARYLAVNTPETTGKIEEYGKKAAAYTREKLQAATSIIIESDDDRWNLDSTGSRYLVWIWYRTSESEDYRNLNIELLQNGLAIASSSGRNRYGTTCTAALAQAKAQKLNIYSGQQDPDFYYGQAVELTLKELRCNADQYRDTKVAFEGVITMNNDNGVFVEEYDPETGLYYGMSVYYGFGLNGEGLNILAVGNRARIVGTLQYYEPNQTYQVSGLSYRMMKPDDPNNIQKISSGNEPSYVPTTPEDLSGRKVEIDDGESVREFDYGSLTLGTSVFMEGLEVREIYTTKSEDSSSVGAMTLTCSRDGADVLIRTVVLYDEGGNRITADAYLGRTIDVYGIVDWYNGTYQVKVFSAKDILIK